MSDAYFITYDEGLEMRYDSYLFRFLEIDIVASVLLVL